jgi:hypothetical protein
MACLGIGRRDREEEFPILFMKTVVVVLLGLIVMVVVRVLRDTPLRLFWRGRFPPVCRGIFLIFFFCLIYLLTLMRRFLASSGPAGIWVWMMCAHSHHTMTLGRVYAAISVYCSHVFLFAQFLVSWELS